jgi:hypothetical protein
MVRVGSNAQVETFLSSNLDKVLVGRDTGSFQGLRGELLILVGNEMNAEGELINVGALPSKIEDTYIQ